MASAPNDGAVHPLYQKDRGRRHQCCDRHAADRRRRRADDAHNARRHRHKQEPEHDDQQCGSEVGKGPHLCSRYRLELQERPHQRHQQCAAAKHDGVRQVMRRSRYHWQCCRDVRHVVHLPLPQRLLRCHTGTRHFRTGIRVRRRTRRPLQFRFFPRRLRRHQPIRTAARHIHRLLCAQRPGQRTHDRRQRPQQGQQPRSRHRARTHRPNIRAPTRSLGVMSWIGTVPGYSGALRCGPERSKSPASTPAS